MLLAKVALANVSEVSKIFLWTSWSGINNELAQHSHLLPNNILSPINKLCIDLIYAIKMLKCVFEISLEDIWLPLLHGANEEAKAVKPSGLFERTNTLRITTKSTELHECILERKICLPKEILREVNIYHFLHILKSLSQNSASVLFSLI